VKPPKEGCVTNITLLFCIFWIQLNENIVYLCALLLKMNILDVKFERGVNISF